MAGVKDISSVWQNIKEIDLKPIRDSATHPVRIALVGEPGVGRHTLAEQMRTDPARPGIHTQSSMAILTFEPSIEPPVAHLIIVLVDATQEDYSKEQTVVKMWSDAGKNVLVFINKIDLVETSIVGAPHQEWQATRVLFGSVNDIAFLQREFVPVMLELLPQQHLALGRQFPLFRLPIARQLISDTCFSNAAYSFSTGVAEIVPILDIPLNVTDMIVLTKSQAFLAYKLGLLFGFSTRWQDYVTEFGGVIGGGFLWRQIARQLIGLIPIWGIIPKVAVSYSGTYVVGNAIMGWYLTGRNLSPKQMRALSSQAFSRGKEYANRLGEKLHRPRLGKRRQSKLPAPQKRPELNQGESIIISDNGISQVPPPQGTTEIVVQSANEQIIETKPVSTTQRELTQKRRQEKRQQLTRHKKKEVSKLAEQKICEKCGKTSLVDASYCQYCGNPFGRFDNSGKVH
jgi:uncharacterized protein (DUF697 family)